MTAEILKIPSWLSRENEGRTWERTGETLVLPDGVYLHTRTTKQTKSQNKLHLIRQDEYESDAHLIRLYDLTFASSSIAPYVGYDLQILRTLKSNGGWMTASDIAKQCNMDGRRVGAKIARMANPPIETVTAPNGTNIYRYWGD